METLFGFNLGSQNVNIVWNREGAEHDFSWFDTIFLELYTNWVIKSWGVLPPRMLTTRLSEQVGWKRVPLTFLLVTYTAESYTEHVSRAQMNYRLSAYHAYLKTQIQINIYYWQEITYPTPRILESPCSSLPLWSFLPHLTYICMHTHLTCERAR